MSIGTSHVFHKLTKDSEALEGQRLVRLIAKGKNKADHLQESLCVSVPTLTGEQVAEHIDQLLPYVVSYVQDIQDKIIREYRVTTGSSDIHEDLFDVPHVIEWLAENGTVRLTKEYMQEWFMEDYGDVARQWITNRLVSIGTPNPAPEKVEQHTCILRDVISGWYSGGKYNPSIPQLKMMIAFAGDVEQDSIMSMVAKNSSAKLEKLLSETEENALGF